MIRIAVQMCSSLTGVTRILARFEHVYFDGWILIGDGLTYHDESFDGQVDGLTHSDERIGLLVV